MPRDRALGHRALLAALGAALLLSACGGLGEFGGSSRDRVAPAPVVDRAQTQAQAMIFYLELLHRMVLAPPAEQAEMFANIKRDHDASPSPGSQLRFALALSSPNHPSSDPSAAHKLLRQVVAAPEALTPVENAVAYLELSKLDRQLALTTENQRLQALGDRNDRDRIAALNRRLAAEADENARLKKALDEARAKLDAIADIERQSTQRKPTTTQGRSP